MKELDLELTETLFRLKLKYQKQVKELIAQFKSEMEVKVASEDVKQIVRAYREKINKEVNAVTISQKPTEP